ncbi:MAG: formate dehydrogenase, partial [Halieaceae bacterium]
MTVWFVPRDAAAKSMGADGIASALLARGEEVIRTGSRGMLWLEPLVECASERNGSRVGWSNVTLADVNEDRLDTDHPAYLGEVDLLTYLSRQQRWIYERVGIIDPLDPQDFQRHGGLAGLKAAMAMAPADVLEAVKTSGLRGRGGAGFPAGIKWQTVADQEPAPLRGQPSRATRHKFICVNADEGDSGTFADRMLMEGDPFSLLEGMAIAAYAVGADRGMIYLRSEYPEAWDILCSAIEVARSKGWLGESVLGSNFAFDVEVRLGAGSYVCGEETAMLESLEGR